MRPSISPGTGRQDCGPMAKPLNGGGVEHIGGGGAGGLLSSWDE